MQNFLGRAVTGTPKAEHITPALKSLHLLKKKSTSTTKSSLLLTTFFIPRNPNTSEDLSILNRWLHLFFQSSHSTPPPTSSLKISNRSYNQTAPILWNNLPESLKTFSNMLPNSANTSQCSFLPLSLSKTQFRSHLKTYIFASYTHLNLLFCSD